MPELLREKLREKPPKGRISVEKAKRFLEAAVLVESSLSACMYLVC